MQVLPRLRGRAWRSLMDRRTRRDLRLARRLFVVFEGDGVPDEGLQFYVQNGLVTIYGTVHSRRARAALLRAVRAVPGVKAVAAQVQVVAPQFEVRGEP